MTSALAQGQIRHPSSASPPAVNCPVGDQLTIVERMSLASGTSGGTAQLNRVSALRTKLRYLLCPKPHFKESSQCREQLIPRLSLIVLLSMSCELALQDQKLDQHAEYLHNPAQ